MNNRPGQFRVFLANLLWLISCIPGWIAFLFASRFVRQTQTRILSRILKQNAVTDFGRKHHFGTILASEGYRAVPLSEYEDFLDSVEAIKSGRAGVLTAEPVGLLQPTSGSTAATKLIPYTQSLRREFKAAIDPWIASLYLAHPGLLFGRHYWSISSSTPPPTDPNANVKVGFADDAEYLGAIQRRLARALFVMPPEVSRVSDRDAFEYLTLLFLCREKNLRLISIWHPSFLTVLLKALRRHLPSIIDDVERGSIKRDLALSTELRDLFRSYLSPDFRRAGHLRQVDVSARDWPQAIWPWLRMISCWTDGISEPWASELVAAFPRAAIQGKGLTATEGMVSFPLGPSGQKVCAIRSHYLEFIDSESEKVLRAWEVEEGRDYSVILTTSGGLYRYRLHDLVRVTGFFNQAPCLAFISRDNLVSDMVGEKLNARHVEESLRAIERESGFRFRFAMLAPFHDDGRAGYVLYAQTADGTHPDYRHAAGLLEAELCRNYHYQHARRCLQLEPIRVYQIEGDAEAVYRLHFVQRGMKMGDIKFQALSTERTWDNEFAGAYTVSSSTINV